MCSEGVSVWFTCKLCKSFFLNADDFAYHKKKSHVQEFRNTKFIVFEEQTTPPASPPENWVSFLSPKEETLIHKVISSPSSTTTTNVDCNPSNENHQSIRNEEFIEIDLESNKVFIFNDQDDRPGDVNQKRDKNCTTIIESALKHKSSSLRKTKEKLQNILSNPLQAVIQSPHNPYIYLKRLKSSSSFADVKEVTPKTEVESEMCITNNEEGQSSATNLLLSKNLDDVCIADCKTDFDHDVVSSNDNDAWEENISETPNSSKNISRDPLSSLESILPDLTTSQTTSSSVLFKCRFCCKKIKSGAFQTHVQFCKNLYSNQDQQSNLLINHDQNRFHGDLIDLVKMEFTEEIEDSEFSLTGTGVDTDPFQSESQMESSAEETLTVVATSSFSNNTSDGFLQEVAPQIDFSRYCISCQKYFASIQDLKIHNRNHHGTQEGKRNFQCPHPNCEKTTKTRSHLRMHIMQVHSAARPFVCPHPNCSLSFKTSFNRNRHAKQPHLDTVSGEVQVSNTLEATITNAPVSPTANSDSSGIAPAIDFSRYCVACQQYFVHIQELRSHNQNFHRTQEGHLSYKCPHSNCGKTTAAQYDLRIHLMQAHSSARPFKCPHPNCNMSFKIIGDRNRHFKCHTKLKGNK